MIKRRLVAIALVVLCLFVPGVARASVRELSVEHATALALETSAELKIMELELIRAELEIEQIVKLIELNAWVGAPSKQTLDRLEVLNKSVDTVKTNIKVREYRLAADVKDAYYSLLLSQKQLEIQEASYKSLLTRFEYEQRRFAQGMASEIAVATMGLRVEESSLALEKLRAQVESAKVKLNVYLGLPLYEELALLDNLELTTIELDLEASLELALNPIFGELSKAVQDYDDVYSALRGVSNWDLDYVPTVEDYMWPTRLTAAKALFEAKLASIKLKQAEQAVRISVTSKVNDVLFAEWAVRNAERDLELEHRTLVIEEKKWQVGLTTHLALVDQMNKVAGKELDLLQKIYQYNKAVQTLRLAEIGL